MRGNIKIISEGSCDKTGLIMQKIQLCVKPKKKKVILNCNISQHYCISFLNKLPFKSITKQKSYWPQTPCLYYNNWVLTLNLISKPSLRPCWVQAVTMYHSVSQYVYSSAVCFIHQTSPVTTFPFCGHYHRWKQVYSRCGVKSISHGSTPAGRPVPEWAVCGRCKCGAQSQSWAWSPTHTVHNVEHFSYISLRSSLTTCFSVGVCALCVCV